jgi:hypothetical protein
LIVIFSNKHQTYGRVSKPAHTSLIVNGKSSKSYPRCKQRGITDFAPSGTDLLKYSLRASPAGTCGSGHSSRQQAGGYSGKRNKKTPDHYFHQVSYY